MPTLLTEATRTKISFDAAVNRNVKAADRLDREAIREMLKLLRKARTAIMTRIALAPSEFLEQHLDALKGEVQRALTEFETAWIHKYEEITFKAEDLATSMVAEPLEKVGVTLGSPALPASRMQALSKFHADKIKAVSQQAIDKITTEISLGLLGGKSKDQLMKDVAKHLPMPKKAGSIAARAARIVRTETNRVHAVATHLRMEDAVSLVPTLKKAWLPENDSRTRLTHLQAGIDFGADNAIPVDEPFKVGGHEAMHPRDPNLPAEEVVNCRCREIPVVPEIA